MKLLDRLLGKFRFIKNLSSWREVGGYFARFIPFGQNIYKSDIVRACIRPLAEYTSKARATSSDKNIERILTYSPNVFMSGKDFLAKCRNLYEVQNTLFILIYRDNKGKPTSFYPIPYKDFEALESSGDIYIKFHFRSRDIPHITVAWQDLAVLRKDYLFKDIGGEDNSAILEQLGVIKTTNDGIANAVKSTANLRGILKNTKSMLDAEDLREQKDRFIKDYMNLENSGGIASLDATQEFTPITINPSIVNSSQMKEFRENIFRYFGVSDAIIQSTAKEDELEAFYSSKIEPFLLALSLELTRKVFTERELAWDAFIKFTASRLDTLSHKSKLELVSLVDRGALTPNEWRAVFGLNPIDGGDMPIRRLDTAPAESVINEPEEVNNEE